MTEADLDPAVRDAAALVEHVAGMVSGADDLITRCVMALDDLYPDADTAHRNAIMVGVTALAEQWDAAGAASAKAAYEDELAELSGQSPPTPVGRRSVYLSELPDWVRLGVWRTEISWRLGKARTCMHAPSPHSGDLAYVTAWEWDLVVCPKCTHLMQKHPDKMCDRLCGQPIVGGSWIASGRLVFMMALCESHKAEIQPYSAGPVRLGLDDDDGPES